MSKQLWIVALGLFLLASAPLLAAPTAEQKAEVAAISELVAKAAALFKEQKFQDCGATLTEAQQRVELLAAAGDKIIYTQLTPIYKRIQNAHALLELEGVELPELKRLADLKPEKPAKPEKPKDEPKPAAPAAGAVSFVKQVVPILVGKCGGCHVNQSKGDFGMPNYAALIKGSKAGRVVTAGEADGSVLFDKIKDGEMPPGGKLPPEQIDIIQRWINEGAKFDGTNETLDLARLVPGGVQIPAPAEPVIAVSTGKETVSFSRDIAGVIAKTCVGCHGVQNPRGNYSQVNFTAFMKGGDGGAPVIAGKPVESYLIKKLKGTGGGQRMPAGGLPPLDEAVMAKIEKWIEEGATFDGPDPNATMDRVAALAKAAGATHTELAADREKGAIQTWNTTMPMVKFDQISTTNFFIVGNIGEQGLQDIADRAEKIAPRVAEIFGAPTEPAIVRGKMSLFVVKERYDFSEIAKFLSGMREIPNNMRNAWRFDGIDAAAVFRMPRTSEEFNLDAMIAQQLGSVYLASIGKTTPRWFAEGGGRVIASRLGSDPRINEWDGALPAVFASLPHSAAFLDKNYEPEAAGIAQYSYVRYLMANTSKFSNLLTDLRKGGKFDERFTAQYMGPPAAVTQLWYKKGPGKSVKPKTTAGNK